jgi:hypothetical protein
MAEFMGPQVETTVVTWRMYTSMLYTVTAIHFPKGDSLYISSGIHLDENANYKDGRSRDNYAPGSDESAYFVELVQRAHQIILGG